MEVIIQVIFYLGKDMVMENMYGMMEIMKMVNGKMIILSMEYKLIQMEIVIEMIFNLIREMVMENMY